MVPHDFLIADNPSSSTSNATIKSQSLLTPSKIFSVLSKPAVLIQSTQTSESRKHKSDSNSTEIPNEKRFKSSSSSSSKQCTSDMTANEELSGRVDVGSSTFEEGTLNVEKTSTSNKSSGPGTIPKSLQMPGTSSAFTEPIKTRPTTEKRHRSSDDESKNDAVPNSNEQSVSENASSTETHESSISNVASPSSTGTTSKNVSKLSQSSEQPSEKRFKSSENTDSQADPGASSNSSNSSQPVRTSVPARNQGRYCFVDFNSMKPPPSYSSAMAGANSSQRPCSFKIRIPLEREANSDAPNGAANDTRWVLF